MNRTKSYTENLAAQLPPRRVEKARKEAEREIFNIRLSSLRKKMGVRQQDVSHFAQPSVSKLEARKDMRVSTLIEYLSAIGMGVEIKTYPKRPHKKDGGEITLLRV